MGVKLNSVVFKVPIRFGTRRVVNRLDAEPDKVALEWGDGFVAAVSDDDDQMIPLSNVRQAAAAPEKASKAKAKG